MESLTEEEGTLDLEINNPPQHNSLAIHKFLELKHLECQEKVLNTTHHQLHLNDSSFCSAVWDGAICWPKTRAGLTASMECPDYIPDFNHNGTVTKSCTENGTWYVNLETNIEWTNFSQCHYNVTGTGAYQLIGEWLPIIKSMSQVGYGLSLVTLVIAFFILLSIKKLRCPRNTLHMNLFLSFIFRAFMALLKHLLFVDGIGFPQSFMDGKFLTNQANWQCKLFTTAWQYCIVANYTWILMEGLYLYNLIFLAPFSDSSAITAYVILGWGLPLLVCLAWAGCRIILDDTLCWTTHHNNENLFLIIRIPIILTIVLNFVFFVNIARVLLVKLQSAVSIETRKYRYRKWSKSTLVLVPLFGIHYMIFLWMSYYMGTNPLIEVIWLFCDQLFASFQGFFVAILYCLLNGEVRSELMKRWKGWRTETGSTMGFPLQHITSRFQHRSTHEEDLGMSNTSMAGVLNNCTVRQPLQGFKGSRTMDKEVTEEHHIDITQEDRD